jgi:Ulp1 family protease
VINNTSKVVTVTFSKDILEGTSFDDINISLNGTPLTTITKTTNGHILSLTNTTSYTDGTYTVNIPVDAVIDEAGNSLETSFTSEFTIDTIAPTITSIDPVDGAVLNDTSKVVMVTFSKDILEGTNFDDINISLNGTSLNTITKSISGNVLTLTNTASYADGTYTVNIPINAVVDAAGNDLDTAFSSVFTVDTVVPVYYGY